MIDDEQTPEDLPDVDQFDDEEKPPDAFLAWVAEQDPTDVEYTTIYGVEVEIPTDVPLLFEAKVEALNGGTADDDAVNELVEILFGSDVYDRWVQAGMTSKHFSIVFTWGLANANGKRTTFAEAAELVKQSREDPGPTNRAERRAAARPHGSASGRSVRPTSRGSTASRRRSSRG